MIEKVLFLHLDIEQCRLNVLDSNLEHQLMYNQILVILKTRKIEKKIELIKLFNGSC